MSCSQDATGITSGGGFECLRTVLTQEHDEVRLLSAQCPLDSGCPTSSTILNEVIGRGSFTAVPSLSIGRSAKLPRSQRIRNTYRQKLLVLVL